MEFIKNHRKRGVLTRVVSIVGATAMLTAGGLAVGAAANATPAPYVIAAWQMPSYVNGTTASWPQTLALHQETSSTGLGQLDSQMKCGTAYQVDLYNNDATTTSLLAGGHLASPNHPKESLIAGGFGTAYKVVKTADCAPALSNMIATSNTLKCNVATITLENRSPWIYPVSVETDGTHSYGPTVDNRTNGALNGPQKDASATRTITFAANTGDHTVNYRVDAGSERDLYTGLAVGTWTNLVVHTSQSTDANAACYIAPTAVTPPVKTPPVVTPPATTPPTTTPPAATPPKTVTPPVAHHTTFVPQAQHFEANTGVTHSSIFPSWMVWSAFVLMSLIALAFLSLALRANKEGE